MHFGLTPSHCVGCEWARLGDGVGVARTNLGLALSAALARNRRDLTTRRAEGIGAGNGGLVLPPRVYQGAPQTLLGSQRGLVVDSGGRCCLRAKDKVSLGSVEMEWTLAGGVPFGRILAEEGLARTEAGNAKRRCKRQREEKVKEAARGKSQQGRGYGAVVVVTRMTMVVVVVKVVVMVQLHGRAPLPFFLPPFLPSFQTAGRNERRKGRRGQPLRMAQGGGRRPTKADEERAAVAHGAGAGGGGGRRSARSARGASSKRVVVPRRGGGGGGGGVVMLAKAPGVQDRAQRVLVARGG